MNFIAFNFCDNDFHTALRETVEFLSANLPIADMELYDIRMLAISGVQAFHALGSIANNRTVADYTTYIGNALTVFTVHSFDELRFRNQGEGYVYNTQTGLISYWGGH